MPLALRPRRLHAQRATWQEEVTRCTTEAQLRELVLALDRSHATAQLQPQAATTAASRNVDADQLNLVKNDVH